MRYASSALTASRADATEPRGRIRYATVAPELAPYAGANNDEFVAFLKAHFQLALLTEAETQRLNRHNRSKLTPDRLKSAGISLAVDSDIVGSNA